ncbi:hypothetical protein SAMN05421720_1148 [Rhodospira trueperi]|uniref:Uncharacterized protein n=1 Tax=Rhodospira trueperi TaxID=69960 RepID=A0A1G7GAP8_9PROT|nr:hypothetical protein SAMN05421720_1148 [Rhodospira trueperi]
MQLLLSGIREKTTDKNFGCFVILSYYRMAMIWNASVPVFADPVFRTAPAAPLDKVSGPSHSSIGRIAKGRFPACSEVGVVPVEG